MKAMFARWLNSVWKQSITTDHCTVVTVHTVLNGLMPLLMKVLLCSDCSDVCGLLVHAHNACNAKPSAALHT